MAESYFTQVEIPQQKTFNEITFPIVLSANPSAHSCNLLSLTQAIKTYKPWLESILHKTGAIIFRGFPVNSAPDFNTVIEAFGFVDFPYVGGGGYRNTVIGRVSTANDAPPHNTIPFHHEMSYLPKYPSKLFFFCEVEPKSGGETSIVLSHIIYERMKQKHPEFVENLEEHGLIYTRVLGEEDDPTSVVGRGWKSTFSTDDKTVAEARAGELGLKVEWTIDGMKTILGPHPGVKFDETRQRNIWFNAIVSTYKSWKNAINDPAKAITFGDGEPLPADIVYDSMRILDEESVNVPWEKGDIMLLDNLAVLHARRPFEPPRRILASLCK